MSVLQILVVAALALHPGATISVDTTQAASPLDSLPSSTGTTAFVDVTVVPMDRERVIAHQTVIVRDGRIVALGATASTTVPAGATRIDGRGKYLMPGLVDMHAHFAAGTESLSDGAGRQLALYLANGFTTVRTLSGPPAVLPTTLVLRDRINRAEVLGPTLYVAGPSLNGRSVSSPRQGVQMVEDEKRAGYDLLKTHGLLPAETYDSIADAAHRVGLRLVGHVTPEYGLVRAMAAGQQVEHLDGYIDAIMRDGAPSDIPGQLIVDPAVLANIDTAKITAIARETARRNIWNGPTLALFEILASDATPDELARGAEMRYAPPAAIRAWKEEKARILAESPADGRHTFIDVRRRLVKALHDAGAKLLVGSDSPMPFNLPAFGALHELDSFVGAGLSPYDALVAATRNPAEWLGRADVGTVAVGKRADLILVDANPLENVDNVRRLSGTMLNGRWLPPARLAALRDGVAAAVAHLD